MIAYKNSTVLAFILWSRLYLGLIFFPIEIFVCFRVFVIKKTTLSPEIKLATSVGLSKEQEFQKNIYFCFIDYTKAYSNDHNKLENSERDGNTRSPDLPPEKSVCRSRSNSLN